MWDIVGGVLKPGRYIGGEWNAVRKKWEKGMLKAALCFPDIYEIGMSHLGMRIIYGVLNREKDIICERVFAPWSDMEQKMRAGNITLFSLENRKVLREFDVIGFSLQYEMSFTDVLNMLDLGRVPVRADERGDNDPIVIAGGPCCFNPEPMADFIDAFVVGEGEEAVLEIAKLVKGSRLEAQGSRAKTLSELAKISGVYVPQAAGNERNRGIKKCIVKDLDGSYFPESPIVPYIRIVHDRISLEIMRGCPHRCKFCQARKIFHPLRLRSAERILEMAGESVRNTGYEELSLLSLSTGDYPGIDGLVKRLRGDLRRFGIRISLPSLWVRDLDDNGIGGLIRKVGLTFAPEAGSDRLRGLIGKDITNEELIQKSLYALKSGWKKVKLYFMIGLPGETYEDIEAIAALCSKIKNVTLSVSPFIPKPHSDLEREAMDSLEGLNDKKEHLFSMMKAMGLSRGIRVSLHDPEMSRIEAVLSRGDGRIAKVVYRAWEKGARLQAWTEYFDYAVWMQCFDECGIDPEGYLDKKDGKQPLPWSFIGT